MGIIEIAKIACDILQAVEIPTIFGLLNLQK